MAFFESRKFVTPSTKTIFSLLQLFMLLAFIPSVKATTFKYPSFDSVPKNLILQGNASSTSGFIQLTTNRRDADVTDSISRVIFAEAVRLWDSDSGEVADFTTHFSFTISMLNPNGSNIPPDNNDGGDGLAFFLAPKGSTIPPDSGGNCLGLYSQNSKFNSSDKPVVAIEFDTYQNTWDPWADHVGIDINSIESVATWNATDNTGLKNGSRAYVLVSYNSSTTNLSVYLTFAQNPIFATGESYEFHNILSWDFNSPELPSSPAVTNRGTGNGGGQQTGGREDKCTIKLVIGLVVGGSVLAAGLGLVFFVWRERSIQKKDEEDVLDISTNEDYEKGTGPKRFNYGELARATSNFTEEGKLGEGGFGGVYRGILSDSNEAVAVKKISRGSRQGKKEFVSEVKIISQLRHRNLV